MVLRSMMPSPQRWPIYHTSCRFAHDEAGGLFFDRPGRREAAGLITLCCVVKAGSPVGEPLAVFSDRKILLAVLANWLCRWSNTMADDFVDRFAGRAEIEKVVHYRSASLRQTRCFRLPRAQEPRQLLASSPAAFRGRACPPLP